MQADVEHDHVRRERLRESEGLLAVLDRLDVEGYGPATAVGPWRSAVKQVVAAVERTDDVGTVDIRALDVEPYLDRFETIARGEYKVESIHAYRRRFTQAVEAYLAFIDTGKPPTFRSGSRRSRTEKRAAGDVVAASAEQPQPQGGDGPASDGPSRERMIDYPFPLRSGSVATLRLPARLEKADAERLASFMRTLVFEPVLELTVGSHDEDAA